MTRATIVFIWVFASSTDAPGRSLRDHLTELVAARVVGHLLRREGEWHERADLASGQFEVARQNADDLVRFAVHPDVASDNRCIASEPRLPRAVGKDHLLVGSGRRPRRR